MNNTIIFGHQNPDTDSICSAIAYSTLKNKLGHQCEPIRLGLINPETQFVLDYFAVKAPRLLHHVSKEAENAILVDHNEPQQSAIDINEIRIVEVIDHHRISNFESKEPLYFRIEPVGCTATILNKLYKENQIEIDKKTAGLMVSAIISDTLLFKSPTCTKEDIDAAHELSKIAEVSLEKYGLDMLKSGANLKDKTVEEIISMDAKEFQMGTSTVEIAQVNVVDTSEILPYKDNLEQTILSEIKEKNLDLFVLIVTDILTNNSLILALGEKQKKVEQAFHITLTQNLATLKGVVSRKKQVVPPLTHVFQE
ncbi:manganese-dependent inorganic pyrophosphatase [Ammoniphilus resinae]|uniref:Probable manganese-dependent inorganic pyrophosphatase n=1 Tax=Ammoniphilus resinae TaxID=861532 RepID=A0ABS4GS56_9BACL|nr:manganese-dependent inorganic pyrophosphatase [Ammoniphilus resinae]MBP1933081.1 manganese-dependent inorganic pyrophosphatase [Ammoniphilus resinae]